MAIKLRDSVFYDIYNNSTNDFKANAGDNIIASHQFELEIGFVSSLENQLKIDKLQNRLSRSQGSFLTDGFRHGQICTLNIVNNTNSTTETYTNMTITAISDLEMTITGLPNRNNWNTGTDYIAVLLSNSTYDSVNFAFNFVDNESATETLESLIDQETSKFVVDGINSIAVNDVLAMTQIGKKSGQFTASAYIKRLVDVVNPYTAFNSTRKRFLIQIYDVVFPAMFDTNSFIGDNCLKYYSKTSFKITSSDSLAPTTIEYKQKANTGLWNEAFNQDNPLSKTSSLVSNLYFNQVNNFTVQFTTQTSDNITSFELGAMYLTIDDDFNKNKDNGQEYYLPFLKTGLISVADIGNDWLSSTTYPFNIALDNYTQVDSGGTRTHTLTLALNTFYANPNGFGKFIEGRGDLDRNFLLWAKVGNTNRLFFDGQLELQEPVGVEFDNLTECIINHDNNGYYKNIDLLNNSSNSDFNIEDDVSYVSEFKLFSKDSNEAVICKVIARNDATGDEFVLNKVDFDLTNIDLQYFINQTLPISNNLPDSSNKKEAFLYEKTPLATGEMTVRLYYPIIIDWRYWEDIFNAHPYFISKNKNNNNWFNYVDLPWKVKVKIEIRRNGVLDYNYTDLPFKNYDDWTGTSTIELFNDTETTQYTSLQENMNMMIKATHVFPSAYGGFPWGMITIEPSESSPRYIISTEIDRTQPENPLIGIADVNRCDMEFATSDTIILRCFVNTNLLNGTNFCITSKISEEGKDNNHPLHDKLTELGEDKILENALETKVTD